MGVHMMKSPRLLSAVVLCVAVFSVTISVAHAQDFAFGRVAALNHFENQGFFAEVQTASDRVTVQMSEELWNQLDLGDTLVLRGEAWFLLHKGIGEGSAGSGEKSK